jgi:hypothetical protein
MPKACSPTIRDPKPCQRDKVNRAQLIFYTPVYEIDGMSKCLDDDWSGTIKAIRLLTWDQSDVFAGNRAMRSIVSSLSTSVCQTTAATWIATIPRMIHDPAT